VFPPTAFGRGVGGASLPSPRVSATPPPPRVCSHRPLQVVQMDEEGYLSRALVRLKLRKPLSTLFASSMSLCSFLAIRSNSDCTPSANAQGTRNSSTHCRRAWVAEDRQRHVYTIDTALHRWWALI